MTPSTEGTKIPLLINPKSKRIACVLMQASYGYGAGNWIVSHFDKWDTGEGMDDYKRVSGTVAQWKQLAEKWNAHHGS
jgi:hypothetical protein